MPVIKCHLCGHFSNYEKTTNCSRCSTLIIIQPKIKQKASRTQKIVLSIFFSLLLLGGIAYGATVFISMQEEEAKLAAEKKEIESFDYITFNTDADSISKAVETLPKQFNSPQPPSLEELKNSVGRFVSTKTDKQQEMHQTLSSKYTVGSDPVSTPITVTYKLSDIQPLQYNYVRGKGNTLVCFVNYRAVIGIFKNSTSINPVYSREAGGTIYKKLEGPSEISNGDSTVNETARYVFSNGVWSFVEAGLTELNWKMKMNEIRVEARSKA